MLQLDCSSFNEPSTNKVNEPKHKFSSFGDSESLCQNEPRRSTLIKTYAAKCTTAHAKQ